MYYDGGAKSGKIMRAGAILLSMLLLIIQQSVTSQIPNTDDEEVRGQLELTGLITGVLGYALLITGTVWELWRAFQGNVQEMVQSPY